MPVTAADLLKKLLAKAGVTYDGDLAGEIPDETATALDNNLLTIAAATNNHPDVKKVYFAQAYNGLDAEIKDLITEYGLPDEVRAEIERAGGSTKKAVALVKKIKELGDKAAPADTAKHAAAITELNNKLAAEIAKQTELKTTFDNQLKGIKVQTKLEGMIGGYKTVYDEIPEAKGPAIQALITKALQDSDADFTFDEKGNLSLVKKDGTNLFGDNHTLVTPQSFIDKTLSKILKVKEAAPPKNTTAPIPGQQNPANPALEAALAESMQAYSAATKPVTV
jgi:hypothetical protein